MSSFSLKAGELKGGKVASKTHLASGAWVSLMIPACAFFSFQWFRHEIREAKLPAVNIIGGVTDTCEPLLVIGVILPS